MRLALLPQGGFAYPSRLNALTHARRPPHLVPREKYKLHTENGTRDITYCSSSRGTPPRTPPGGAATVAGTAPQATRTAVSMLRTLSVKVFPLLLTAGHLS